MGERFPGGMQLSDEAVVRDQGFRNILDARYLVWLRL
jgi:hypothetical protein